MPNIGINVLSNKNKLVVKMSMDNRVGRGFGQICCVEEFFPSGNLNKTKKDGLKKIPSLEASCETQ